MSSYPPSFLPLEEPTVTTTRTMDQLKKKEKVELVCALWCVLCGLPVLRVDSATKTTRVSSHEEEEPLGISLAPGPLGEEMLGIRGGSVSLKYLVAVVNPSPCIAIRKLIRSQGLWEDSQW